MIHLGIALGVGAGQGTFTVPAPVSEFYPAVDPVAISAATASVKFPEDNGRMGAPATAVTDHAVYSVGFNFAIPGTTAYTALVEFRLPRAKRKGNRVKALMTNAGTASGTGLIPATGGQTHGLWFFEDDWNGTGYAAGRLAWRGMGSGGAVALAIAPELTEDSALAAFRYDGAGGYSLSWVSHLDGRVHRSADYAGAALANTPATQYFRIGGEMFASPHSPGSMAAGFNGHIARIAFVLGEQVPDAALSAMALGAPWQSRLTLARVRAIREFNGTGVVKPAWATADSTNYNANPLIPAASGTAAPAPAPGSTFVRQSTDAYALLDLGPGDGFVHALREDEKAREVTFRGWSSGPVELRVYNADDGAVVRDWTPLSGWDAGTATFEGAVRLPRGDQGYYHADVRLAAAPAVVGHGRERFGVGYRIGVLGQSQAEYGLGGATKGIAATTRANVAFVPFANARSHIVRPASQPAQWGSLGSDSLVALAETWAAVAGRVPLMVVSQAVAGSGMKELLYPVDDARAHYDGGEEGRRRGWSGTAIYNGSRLSPNEQSWIDLLGGELSAIAWTWFTRDQGANWQPRINALLYGDRGPTGVADASNSFADRLAWQPLYIHMPAMRGSDGRELAGNYAAVMVPYAQGRGQAIGFPAMDMCARFGGSGGEAGHSAEYQVKGPVRFGKALALSVARAFGLTDLAQPVFANARRTAANVIAIDVLCVNGGSVHVPAGPTTAHSWGWRAGGTAGSYTWRDANVVQAVTAGGITLTRTDGDWPATVSLYYSSSGVANPSGTKAAWDALELSLVEGMVYETWAADPLGLGLPVLGGMSGGVWDPNFAVTLA